MVIGMCKKNLHKLSMITGWNILRLALLSVFFTFFGADIAHAVSVDNADDIAENITISIERLPGIIAGIAYLLGLLFGVLAILNFKHHVENPGGQNTVPLKKPIIQLIIGGALFALPMLFETMASAINGGASVTTLGRGANPIDEISKVIGTISGFVPLQDVNQVLENVIESIENVPGLISAAGYLFGLLLGVLGILKIKDHVENPDQTKLKDGVIRLLIGGTLFALPSIYHAMYATIADDGLGGLSFGRSIVAAAGFAYSLESKSSCTLGLLNADLGDVLCASILHTAVIPSFLSAISYIMGLALGLWALVKIRDHVENPTQTKISEGISRLIAGGMFFALPVLIEVGRSTVSPIALLPHTNTGFNETGNLTGGGGIVGIFTSFLPGGGPAGGGAGLSGALFKFMDTLLGPATILLSWFGYVAGAILIMVAIMRVIKSAQEGPKGPGGIGTIMTFITGGALISFNTLMTAFTTSFFNLPATQTYATLQYTTGMGPGEIAHAHIVISAILKFMIILGLISFIRGIFIIRDVAEGKQQASVMAGVTHMIGGSLAVNLGPLLNTVQETLGITTWGIVFS